MSGRYIAFEGVDGAGKSTVAEAVAEQLRADGRQVVTVREPGATAVGEAIREILLHSHDDLVPWAEALLFAAARAQLAEQTLRPLLEAGAWVLSDRSVYSSLAYQGGARGLGVDIVRTVNAAGLSGVWPDLVILLDVEPQTGLAREEDTDRIGAEGLALQQRVAATYRELSASDPRVVSVDGAGDVASVVAASLQQIRERFDESV
ncbi:MAG: dTMP kinase [Acidimicrobiia bacterium]|nr:dTMP kinase [Acidimicrobiia bacterium]